MERREEIREIVKKLDKLEKIEPLLKTALKQGREITIQSGGLSLNLSGEDKEHVLWVLENMAIDLCRELSLEEGHLDYFRDSRHFVKKKEDE